MKKFILPVLVLLVVSNIYMFFKLSAIESKATNPSSYFGNETSVTMGALVEELKEKFNHIKQTIWGDQDNTIPPKNILYHLNQLEERLSVLESNGK